MDAYGYLEYLTNKIHTVIMATIDEVGNPVTCAIDIMDFDETGIYFLTATGKGFYKRLKNNKFISLTGLYGKDTLSSKTITIRGKIKEVGSYHLETMFKKNPYMLDIYPTEESQSVLTVFQMYQGCGEFFDLSVSPIFREQFFFGNDVLNLSDLFYVRDNCQNCGKCITSCPQQCIVSQDNHITILQEHCLHCGRCRDVCPFNAIERR